VYVAYAPDLAFPGVAEAVGAFADLAVASGARRLVLLSGRGEEGAQRGEQAVRDSGAVQLHGAELQREFLAGAGAGR
jgi:hypothetical protein